MFTSVGKLYYSENPIKLVLNVDQQISDYYRATLPKALTQKIFLNKQKYPAHISIVRKEIPPNMAVWRKYQGQRVKFQYEHGVDWNKTYFWINVWSDDIEKIRNELGLKNTSPYTRSPDGTHRFHITIGNVKEHPDPEDKDKE